MITVLLPTYNNSPYITAAVRSILRQTFKDFELLIIDDCSTDDTVSKIKEFRDERIVLFENSQNKGLAETLNFGIKAARYGIVARMDGDDISLPDRLEKQFNFLKSNNNVHILSSFYAVFRDNKILYTVETNTRHEDIKRRLALHSEIMHPAVMYRRNIILERGGYKNAFIEDYELWLRVKDNVVFHNLPEILLLKRYSESSISGNIRRKNESVYEYTKKYYDNPSSEFGIDDNSVNIYRGWREYFYGRTEKARYYFLKSPLAFLKSPSAVTAFFITFLPEKTLTGFKELRLRFRLIYLAKYFSSCNRRLRKYLKANG